MFQILKKLNRVTSVIKTNSSGTQLWTYTWNGSDSLHDVPSAIYLDNSGNAFIVGGSYDAQDAADIALVKLNSSGIFLWQSIYDYNGLDEVPLSIKKWNFFWVTMILVMEHLQVLK